MPFGPTFSINFHVRLNLLICATRIMRKPLLYHFRPSFWHQKSINKSCLFKPSSWKSNFSFSLDKKMVDLGAPSKIQRAPERDQTKKQVVPKWCLKHGVAPITLYVEKNKYMQKHPVDRTFVAFYLFPLRFHLFGNAKNIEKHQADRPSEIYWPPKGKPTKNQEAPSVRRFSMYLASLTLAI